MVQNERLIYLFYQHFNRKNTSVEKEELLQMAMDSANESALRRLIEESWNAPLPLYSQSDTKADDIFNYILNYKAVTPVHRVHFLKTSWFRYAAAVLLLIGGAYVYFHTRSSNLSSPQGISVASANDIQPGGNKAILTVGNQTIDLATNKTGIAVGNVIVYTDGEKLANPPGSLYKGDMGQMLQLATPRGGQYQAVLPDGSKVWLNAASSIKFPSKFTGAGREVEVSGEVYLEIAKNSKQPFRVKANGTEIQVLGTSFNINAYSDEEAVKTTLVEGRVRVSSLKSNVILKPGQQARIALAASSDRQAKEITVVNDADIQQAVAWKTGYFKFIDASIQDVMRQLSRWYDLDVVYEGKISGDRFDGKIARNAMASQILSVLEKNQVHFRIEGKKLIVLP